MTPEAAEVKRCELAVQARPADVAAHRALLDAHKKLMAGPAPEAALAEVTRELPFAFTSLLYLAMLVDARGDKLAAVAGYTRALKTAQLRGFWNDEASTPQWLRYNVLGAMQIAHQGRIDLYQAWLEAQNARYGADEMVRVAKCLRMYLGLEPTVLADERQRPRFLYFPDLPVHPVFPRDSLPFAGWYEAQTEALAREMARVRDGAGVQPFHYDVSSDQQAALTAGGAWDAYFFFDEGERIDAHHDACPETSAVLAKLPLDHVRDHGPEVCFSIMRPGAHILPHRGVTNTRAVLHLGLDIPEGCALHLPGVLVQTWEPGKCFAFDDTFEHEAWNKSDTTRAILLGDIWNPFLRDAEKAAIADLVAQIGDFNRLAAAV
jgi:hypothetical protein